MLIWIINPFDPLPGDREPDGRYATLAKLLSARGHRVCWWTSDFSHRFKRPIDTAPIRQACRELGIDVHFIPTVPYRRNVGLKRLWSHAALARQFQALARDARPAPDVLVASSPPPALARCAARVAQDFDRPLVLDVQDIWPDAFAPLAPAIARPLVTPLIAVLRRDLQRAADGATAIVGVADEYVTRVHGLSRQPKTTATIPLGIDLAAFDAAAARGRPGREEKPAGELWIAYTGGLSHNYDVETLLRAVAQVRAAGHTQVRLLVAGRGESEPALRRLVQRDRLQGIELLGFLDQQPLAALLTQCDAACIATHPRMMIYLPNKIFYYLAAGAAVLNTIPGQCSRIVREGACGLDYTAGDAGSCASAIMELVRDPGRRTQHGEQAVAECGVVGECQDADSA